MKKMHHPNNFTVKIAGLITLANTNLKPSGSFELFFCNSAWSGLQSKIAGESIARLVR